MSLILSFLISVPTLLGPSGSFRVFSPTPHKRGTISFSIYGGYNFESVKYFDVADTANSPFSDRRHHLLGSVSLSYAPFDFWEFGFRGDFEGRQFEKTDIPTQRADDGYFAYRGLEIFTKFGYPFFRDTFTQTEIAGGIALGYYLPNKGIERKDDDFIFYGYPMYVPLSGQFWVTSLLGFKFQIIEINGAIGYWQKGNPEKDYIFPLISVKLDENGLPLIDTVVTAKNEFPDFTRLTYGLNFTLSAGPYVDFIADLHGAYLTKLKENLLAITPGVRFKTPGGVVFDFAVDARVKSIPDSLIPLVSLDRNLITFVPDWRFIFVISNVYNVFPKRVKPLPPPPPPAPKIAKITGKIYDAATGEPIMAQIKLEGTDLPPVSSDTNGFYSVELQPGKYSLYVEKEGYRWMRKTILLKEGAELVIDFPLKKKALVIVTGKILDNITEEPVGAKITIPETNFEGTISDPETGVYRLKLPPGSYILHIEAEGYLPEEVPIVLKEGEPIVKDVKLKKKAKKGVTIRLQNIYFDTGKATIKPESYPILDKVAEFLKANPKAIVEIQGHTDSVGSASYNMRLSQARAEAVRNYLITYHHIDPSRLIAKGYGETRPIADNTTREGRAMNRRVEFVIISTGE